MNDDMDDPNTAICPVVIVGQGLGAVVGIFVGVGGTTGMGEVGVGLTVVGVGVLVSTTRGMYVQEITKKPDKSISNTKIVNPTELANSRRQLVMLVFQVFLLLILPVLPFKQEAGYCSC